MAKKKTDSTYKKQWTNYLKGLQLHEQQAREATRALEEEVDILRKRIATAKKGLAISRQLINEAKKELLKLK